MIGWLAQNMAWAGAVMLLVLVLRRPAARLFGAGPTYALWLLVPLRLFMPPLPASATSPWLPPIDLLVVAAEAAAPVGAESGAGSWLPVLLAIWATGALAFIIWQWLAYRAFLTRLSLSSCSLGGHRGLPLIESAAVPGPLALGLLDRRIVLPVDFASRYSPEERRLALDHEAIHHRRGDIWCNLAALLVLALNWFNPIAWLAFRAFREDQELACDAAVAVRAGASHREDYARALVKSASPAGLIAACPLNHVDQLKRRLKMMKHHRPDLRRTLGGATAVALLAGATLTLGSAGIAHPHPDGEQKQRIVIMEHKSGEARDGAVREFRIQRGENGEIELPDGCRDGDQLADVDERTGNERTRIVLCSRNGGTTAERVEGLQRARERLAENSHMSAEQRARVTAALDREIARLQRQ